MATITIVGAGMMGSALSAPLADAGHHVRLVGTPLDTTIIESLQAGPLEHPKLRVPLPHGVATFFDFELEQALRGADMVALGVSSAGVGWACRALGPLLWPGVPLFMITKGLVAADGKLEVLPDVVRAQLPERLRASVFPAAIGGPCIAGELARRVETCVVLTGRDRPTLDRIAQAIRTPYYHVFSSTEVVGVEACAALKNAYAMGVALAAGLHEKRGGLPGSVAMHNYESAVFAQATVEMRRIVRLLGGDPESVVWLPGVGDLDVTMNGGRTGRFGRLLGMGLDVKAAIDRMEGATLECLEIIDVLAGALPAYEARGEIDRGELPLFWHMAEIVREGRPLAMPFDRFFGQLRG